MTSTKRKRACSSEGDEEEVLPSQHRKRAIAIMEGRLGTLANEVSALQTALEDMRKHHQELTGQGDLLFAQLQQRETEAIRLKRSVRSSPSSEEVNEGSRAEAACGLHQCRAEDPLPPPTYSLYGGDSRSTATALETAPSDMLHISALPASESPSRVSDGDPDRDGQTNAGAVNDLWDTLMLSDFVEEVAEADIFTPECVLHLTPGSVTGSPAEGLLAAAMSTAALPAASPEQPSSGAAAGNAPGARPPLLTDHVLSASDWPEAGFGAGAGLSSYAGARVPEVVVAAAANGMAPAPSPGASADVAPPPYLQRQQQQWSYGYGAAGSQPCTSAFGPPSSPPDDFAPSNQSLLQPGPVQWAPRPQPPTVGPSRAGLASDGADMTEPSWALSGDDGARLALSGPELTSLPSPAGAEQLGSQAGYGRGQLCGGGALESCAAGGWHGGAELCGGDPFHDVCYARDAPLAADASPPQGGGWDDPRAAPGAFTGGAGTSSTGQEGAVHVTTPVKTPPSVRMQHNAVDAGAVRATTAVPAAVGAAAETATHGPMPGVPMMPSPSMLSYGQAWSPPYTLSQYGASCTPLMGYAGSPVRTVRWRSVHRVPTHPPVAGWMYPPPAAAPPTAMDYAPMPPTAHPQSAEQPSSPILKPYMPAGGGAEGSGGGAWLEAAPPALHPMWEGNVGPLPPPGAMAPYLTLTPPV